jgi:hypothetical protein
LYFVEFNLTDQRLWLLNFVRRNSVCSLYFIKQISENFSTIYLTKCTELRTCIPFKNNQKKTCIKSNSRNVGERRSGNVSKFQFGVGVGMEVRTNVAIVIEGSHDSSSRLAGAKYKPAEKLVWEM